MASLAMSSISRAQLLTPSSGRLLARRGCRAPAAASRISAQAQLSQNDLKRMVGYKAIDDYVESGMVVGLGTGSTAYFAVERLGQKLASGECWREVQPWAQLVGNCGDRYCRPMAGDLAGKGGRARCRRM